MNIKDFKYSYRFMEEKYSVFSSKELSEIKVIDKDEIKDFWNKNLDNEIIEKCSFIKKIISHEMPVLINDCGWDNDEKIEETKNKIKDYFNINSNNNVIIYYDIESAIEVKSSLFLERWTDFCYPTDTLIISYNKKILLYYEDIIYILN